MELKVSPEKPGFSSSDAASDPEDKEISEGEDEDDDRNHKHRRREARSHSLVEDSLDQGLTRPYRKRNRPFENGFSYRDGDRQAGETLRNYDSASDRDFPSRFEKRRQNKTPFSKSPLELQQRIRGNQVLPSEVGLVRCRGREPISWGIHDSRLGLVDLPSQVVQPGYVPPALYAGRGFPSVSNTPSTPWNAFGLVPGIPNGGLDPIHPLGLPGALRPAINPPMNLGIPRQRCRDFEERGFCLRGDMCPMEHGVNRIVVDDVQSLSQFNLPVALPGSQLLGKSPGQGALPTNNKSSHAKNIKTRMSENVLGPNGGALGGSTAGASDVYDPDQPLWTNNDPETSAALHALNQSTADGTESFLGVESSDQPNIESIEGFNEEPSLINATTSGPQISSIWGRVGDLKRNSEGKVKFDSVGTSSSYLERDFKSAKALNSDASNQGKQMNVDGNNSLVKESPLKQQSDPVYNIRRPSQKALRTVFVSGIPLKDNRREALLSHFQKFGEVIDIYTPANSERAFVQFSKRGEAEAALKAPDAVMGNRFIKLWWANRDNLPDDRISGRGPVSVITSGLTNRAPSRPFVLAKGQENPLVKTANESSTHASVTQLPVHNHPKPMVGNGPSPKAPPPQQKKLENFELLKELRKKQEMLDQKRNEFRNMLDKLEKQSVGSADIAIIDLNTKRHKGETLPNDAKAENSKSSASDNIKPENSTSSGSVELQKSTSSANVPAQEPLKPAFRPPALSGKPFTVNRFKLDNRPTTFRIISPLPAGLANVAALEEHFSAYGELSSLELEESQQEDTKDAPVPPNVTARVSFTTRHYAEKAFSHGKSWHGHNLQFTWLKFIGSGKEGGSSVKVVEASVMSDANAQAGEINAPAHYEKTAVLGSDENEDSKDGANVNSDEQDNDLKSVSASLSDKEQLS
ncbi:Zinc finger CCCH domain-containing protein 41 [Striga hermonthica]|uniref:Zinc finger CCCH domain-containing protein 41 n=1 Tax=Striga hermonthica TaxID=68872 RepID=A0A9N7NDI3_STRHE|nr:Zinc finger CCCH domain-containing protein 41 [Striga hermonthica]